MELSTSIIGGLQDCAFSTLRETAKQMRWEEIYGMLSEGSQTVVRVQLGGTWELMHSVQVFQCF